MTEREKLEQDYLRSYDVPHGCLILAAGMAAIGVMFFIATIIWVMINLL